jgi:hypothetical protein
VNGTIAIRVDRFGQYSLLEDVPTCVGCHLEVEVAEYFVRTYVRKSDGEPIKVRVGYHCSCGAVVVDGMYEGSSPMVSHNYGKA